MAQALAPLARGGERDSEEALMMLEETYGILRQRDLALEVG